MAGWESLGSLLGGGASNAAAAGEMEGMKVGAQTQNALAQARNRRADTAKKMGEIEARDRTAESLFLADLVPDYATGEAYANFLNAGHANLPQMFDAQLKNQELGFRERMADPSLSVGDRNIAAMGVASGPQDPFGHRGGLFYDIFAPENIAQTPESQALTFQRQQAGELSQAKRLDPAAFRSGGVNVDLGGLLTGAQGIPTGIDPTINFAEGVGVPALGARLANIFADIVPGMPIPFEDREKAINALEDLQGRTIMSAKSMVDQRMSNQLMDMMQSFAVKPADVLKGESRSLTRLSQTRDFLRARSQELQLMLSQGGGTSSQRFGLQRDLITLTNLADAYDQVVSQFEGTRGKGEQGPQPGTVEDGYEFIGGDPADPNNWRQVQ